MDFLKFCKELEAHFWGARSKLMGLKLPKLELRLEKIISRSFKPMKSAEFSGRFGHHVHLEFHLLMIGLGASGSPLFGCVVNP
nr:hypothetical protein [Tanacetum cinerariifolium]